jgi:CheY-like chemotaxis protein
VDGPIIIIDDLDISLELMKSFLNKAGFENIITYECPIKALHDIEQGLLPSIIVTDYRMPGMNGLQFLEAAFSVCRPVPSIIITGDPGSIDLSGFDCKILEKGNLDFFQILINTVKNYSKCEYDTNLYTQKPLEKKFPLRSKITSLKSSKM